MTDHVSQHASAALSSSSHLSADHRTAEKRSEYLKVVITAAVLAAVIAFIRVGIDQLVYAPVDYGVYRNIGRYVLAGESLYTQPITGPLVHGLPFVYTPFAALVLTPLHWAPEPFGLWLWTFLNALALVGITLIGLRARGWRLISPVSVLVLTAVVGVFALFNVSAQHLVFGQINLLLVLLCLYDLVRRSPSRFLPRGVLIGIAAGIKLTPLLFIAFFAITRRWREFFVSAASFAATMAIGAILLPHGTVEFFGAKLLGLSSVVELDGNFATSGNSSLQGVAERWFGTHDLVLLAPVLLAVVAAAFWSADRALGAGEPVLAASVLGVAMCLLSPVSWLHHWAWVYPAVLLLVGRGRWATALGVGWSLLCLAQVTDLGDILGRAGGPELLAEVLRSAMVLLGLAYVATTTYWARKRYLSGHERGPDFAQVIR